MTLRGTSKMKTKLGISVAMLTALTYIFGLFGGYIALALLVGYILLCEENTDVKKAAVKTVIIVVAFDLVNAVIALLPNGISIIDNFLNIFNVAFPVYFVSKIYTFISSVLAFAEKIIFLVLAFMAWSNKNCKLPVLDDLVDKHM
jgi:uncharacterized membrane protein